MITPNLKTVNELYSDFIQRTPPETPLFGFNEQTITLAALRARVDAYTGHLARLGVRPGVVVGYTLPNCPEVIYLYFAISRLGGCALPLYPVIPDRGKVGLLQRAKAQWVVTTGQQYASLKEALTQAESECQVVTVDAHPDGGVSLAAALPTGFDPDSVILRQTPPHLPLLIAASSGTTGTPKSVLMTQSNLAAEVYAASGLVLPFTDDCPQGYSTAMAFPLSTAAMIVVSGVMFSGVFMVFSADVSPVEFIKMASRWRVDSFSAPPAFYEAILSLPMLDSFDRASVKRVLGGMDFFSPSLMQRLKEKFPNLNSWGNGYGLIETSDVIMVAKGPVPADGVVPATGKVTLVEGVGNQIEVRDAAGECVPVGGEGILYVKGPNVVQGYLGNPEETARSFTDGWFCTGDVVRNEGDGSVTLLGRQKHLIKRGGKSVSPVAVQNHLNKLAGVKDSAVVGVPHPLYGEMVWAFIVRQAEDAVQLKDVMKHCRADLPNYMVPDQVTFVPGIPKKPGVGKVDVDTMKAMALKELDSMAGANND
ncbi:MAG TPA: class I adenylate-forming enzyme family protein [Anaerolineae bacterium]|nr:class I adenylate-forming enzyme family protein [Anaerolineae bacterium]